MGYWLPIAIGGSAIGGALQAAAGKKSTTTSQFDPTSQAMREKLAALLTGKLSQPLSIDPALLAQGMGGLNKLFSSGVTNLQNQFSSRGLGQSGLFGGALSNLQLARMGKAGELLNQLMGTAEERQNATIAQALKLANPTGETGTASTGALGAVGAGLGDLSTTIGLLTAMGKLGGKAAAAGAGGAASASMGATAGALGESSELASLLGASGGTAGAAAAGGLGTGLAELPISGLSSEALAAGMPSFAGAPAGAGSSSTLAGLGGLGSIAAGLGMGVGAPLGILSLLGMSPWQQHSDWANQYVNTTFGGSHQNQQSDYIDHWSSVISDPNSKDESIDRAWTFALHAYNSYMQGAKSMDWAKIDTSSITKSLQKAAAAYYQRMGYMPPDYPLA